MNEAELKASYRKVRDRLFSGQAVNKPKANEHPARDRMEKLIARAKDVPHHEPVQFVQPPVDDATLPTWKRIAFEACRFHGIRFNELMAHRRSRHIVVVRHEVMWRLATETDMSLTSIGRRLNKDHTSVLHGVRAHAAKNGLYNPFPYMERSATGKLSRVKFSWVESAHA